MDDNKKDNEKLAVMRQYAAALSSNIKRKEVDALGEKLAELPSNLRLLLLDLFNLYSLNTHIANQPGSNDKDEECLKSTADLLASILTTSSRVLYEEKDIPPVNVPFIQGVN